MDNQEMTVPPEAPLEAPKRPTMRRRPAKKTSVPRIEVAPAGRRAAGPSASRGERAGLPTSFGLLILLIVTGFGCLNLYFMTMQAGELKGLTLSWNELLSNYGTRLAPPAPEPAPVVVAEEKPAFIFSLVSGGQDQQPLMTRLIDEPAAAYYKSAGRPLSAVLIERQKPLSKFVRLRLFFKDGGGTDSLWPFTGSDSDWWVPDCNPAPSETSKKVACPPDFLAQYPDIARLLEK